MAASRHIQRVHTNDRHREQKTNHPSTERKDEFLDRSSVVAVVCDGLVHHHVGHRRLYLFSLSPRTGSYCFILWLLVIFVMSIVGRRRSRDHITNITRKSVRRTFQRCLAR